MEKNTNTQKNREMQQETEHFRMFQAVIRGNITRYQTEYEERHAQVQKLFKAMNGGDTELYNQLMAVSSLEQQAADSLRKNRAALEKPYFGRIDYRSLKDAKDELVYIGKNGIFQNKTDVLIADWRTPVASLYYENELGEGDYTLPDDTKVAVDLKLKRTFDVAEGALKGYYDSDVAANDELLVKYLSRNKEAVLGEIIATIQKEQNAIIRESPFANLIVQGVAGSGKTTVAMHRISYLLYNYKERFASNEFCIIGGSDLLLDYITSGLPELDVPDIKHMRMDQLLVRICEKDWNKKYQLTAPDESAALRCGLDFMKELEYFLMEKRLQLIDCQELKSPGLGVILSASGNMTLLKDHPHFSVKRLLAVMDDRVKTRIRFLMSGFDRDEIQRVLKKYAGHYKNMLPKVSASAYYDEFLEGLKNTGYGGADKEHQEALDRHRNACAQRSYDLYDLAAMALIHYRIFQKGPNEEFGLLFMDEAQDFGLSIYYVLKKLLPDTYFTIMGDVSQNIHYTTGINDWYELTKLFLTGTRDKFLLLQKSYRNTIEISEYAGRILEKASLGRYKITPVIRHGIPVQEEIFWSEPEMAERILEVLNQASAKGYTTAAVICRDEPSVKRASLCLQVPGTDCFGDRLRVLPIPMVKGLEFDVVILWNPDMKHGLERPESAKLLYVAATRALHELYVFTC